MELFGEGEQDDSEQTIEEDMRILTTQVETINQRLNSKEGVSDDMEQKVDYLVNVVYNMEQTMNEKMDHLEDLSQKVEHLINHVYELLSEEEDVSLPETDDR